VTNDVVPLKDDIPTVLAAGVLAATRSSMKMAGTELAAWLKGAL